MPRIEARISENEKSLWRQFCQTKGFTETVMLKMLIKQLCADHPMCQQITSQHSKNKKITIRLTEAQLQVIDQKCQQEGYLNPSHWTLACVLANSVNEPVLTDEEIQALYASNRQIAAIGRNLNQIARALNIEFRDSNKFTLEAVNLLTGTLSDHKLKVAELLHKNRQRWK